MASELIRIFENARPLISANSQSSLKDVYTKMISKQISLIPIIDNNGKNYRGYIRQKDLFKSINGKKELIGKNSIQIDSEGVEVYEIEIENKEYKIEIKEGKTYSLYIIYGELSINTQSLKQDDFIIITKEKELCFNSNIKAKIFCIETDTELTYKSYYETYMK